jgi:hypothetical protein
MLVCRATLKSLAPIAFGKYLPGSLKHKGEGDDAFDKRCWRERAHVNERNEVYIPPLALKNCLAECAKFLAETIKGKGKQTWTKHFEAGIMVTEPLVLHDGKDRVMHKEDLVAYPLYVPADGRRGGNRRVERIFPVVNEWSTACLINVIDPVLIEAPHKIKEYLNQGGQFIGLGSLRARNNGYFGRYEALNFTAEKL